MLLTFRIKRNVYAKICKLMVRLDDQQRYLADQQVTVPEELARQDQDGMTAEQSLTCCAPGG